MQPKPLMKVLCPVCGTVIKADNLGSRDEAVVHCPKCGLYAEVTLKKDKIGRIWSVVLTEKRKDPAKSADAMTDSFLYFVYIAVIIFLVMYLLYQLLNTRAY